MKGKYNHVFSVIIALIILFCGMCVEPASADSLFACADNNVTTSYLSSQEGPVSHYELSTREMVGARDAAVILGIARKPAERNIIRLSLILILAEALFAGLSNIQTNVETMSAPETHYVTALLNYIHSQDGEK